MRGERQDMGPAALARNYLQGCVLLLVAESPAHGYELLDQLSGLGLAKVDSGALYRALRGLNDDGLVESWWEKSSAGPARRTYRLTDEGAEYLGRWAQTVATSSTYLDSFLARHRQLGRWRGRRGDGRAFPRGRGAA